jgi:hypothetical protein
MNGDMSPFWCLSLAVRITSGGIFGSEVSLLEAGPITSSAPATDLEFSNIYNN